MDGEGNRTNFLNMEVKVRILLWVICLGAFVSSTAYSQTLIPKNLTRDDVLIDKGKPSVFLCIDKVLSSKENGSVWIRVVNNTVWTLRFATERSGESLQPLRLSSGIRVPGLVNKTVFFPRYRLDHSDGSSRLGDPQWSHTSTVSWLPSQSYSVFKVSRGLLRSILYLEFQYEWEIVSIVGPERVSPSTRVLFNPELENFEPSFCEN